MRLALCEARGSASPTDRVLSDFASSGCVETVFWGNFDSALIVHYLNELLSSALTQCLLAV